MMRRITALVVALVLAAPTSAGAGSTSTAMFGGEIVVAQAFAKAGHPVAIARYYGLIGQKFSSPKWDAVMAQGSTLDASLDLAPGQTYAQVAAGTYDSMILPWLQAANAAAVAHNFKVMWIDFQHEANGHQQVSLGTPGQFVQAWDHIHALAASAGLNVQQGGRLKWVLILTHRAYYPPSKYCSDCGTAAAFFPGTSAVDAIGADGYSRLGCTNGMTGYASGNQYVQPTALFGAALSFAQANSLPLIIAEFGADAYQDPSVQAGFITAMQNWVVANPRVIVASYWNGPASATTCYYDIFQYPKSVAALTTMQQVLTGRP